MAKYRFELKSPGFGKEHDDEFLSGKGAPGQYLASWFEIWKKFKQKLTPPKYLLFTCPRCSNNLSLFSTSWPILSLSWRAKLCRRLGSVLNNKSSSKCLISYLMGTKLRIKSIKKKRKNKEIKLNNWYVHKFVTIGMTTMMLLKCSN